MYVHVYVHIHTHSGIGLKSGKAAGMPVLVTKSTYTKDEDFSAADLVVQDRTSIMSVCVDVHMCVCVCVYIYIYIWRFLFC